MFLLNSVVPTSLILVKFLYLSRELYFNNRSFFRFVIASTIAAALAPTQTRGESATVSSGHVGAQRIGTLLLSEPSLELPNTRMEGWAGRKIAHLSFNFHNVGSIFTKFFSATIIPL